MNSHSKNPEHFHSIRNIFFKEHAAFLQHKKHPLQILAYALMIFLIFNISTVLIHYFSYLFWLEKIALSLCLGIVYGSLGLFTHELLHGTILKNSKLTQILAWFGFFIFALSPELWLTWHNRIHHFHTNQSGKDPDTFGLWDDFKKFPMQTFLLKRAPGSKHPLAWIYLALNFTNQAMTVMWYFLWKGDARLFASVDKTVAVFETSLMYLGWIGAFFFFGWKLFFFLLFIPALIANLVTSSYILTQHLFCPLTDENLPLENTLGVTTLGWIDAIHFHFSHHIEHHLFPEINHAHYPALRTALIKAYPDHYRLMSHAQAIKTLLSSPRIYKDAATLWSPLTNESLSLHDIGRKKRSV